MADDVKFVRVRGRVIPIHAGQVGAIKRKKVRDSATSDVTQKEASKTLRHLAKGDSRLSATAVKAANFSLAGSAVALGASFLMHGKRPNLSTALFSAGLLGAGSAILNRGFAQGRLSSANQYRKDASAIGKGKEISGESKYLGAAPARARNTALLLQSNLRGRMAVGSSVSTAGNTPTPTVAGAPSSVMGNNKFSRVGNQ